jgi:hypothetical protein
MKTKVDVKHPNSNICVGTLLTLHAMEQYVQFPCGAPAAPLLRDDGKATKTNSAGWVIFTALRCVVLARSRWRVNAPLLAALEVVVFDGSEGGGEVVPDVHDALDGPAVVDLSQLRGGGWMRKIKSEKQSADAILDTTIVQA